MTRESAMVTVKCSGTPSGHPQDAKTVSVTGAGRSVRECKNTEFVRELRKTGFFEGGRK